MEFLSEEDADYAIKIMNMIKLYGKPIRVNKASAHNKNLDVGANIFIGNLDPEIDEKLLEEIAESTGGRYFRATDNTKLAEIYAEINKMEKAKTTVDSFPVYEEKFALFALLALAALLLELMIDWFIIRRLP